MGYKLKLSKDQEYAFLNYLRREYKVYIPVKKEEAYFWDEAKDSLSIPKDYTLTFYPFREFLLPPREELLFWKENMGTEEILPTAEKIIFWGLRSCDIEAIKRLDIVFMEEIADPYYLSRREKIILCGLPCKEECEFGFCKLMGTGPYPTDGFDILLEEEKDCWYLYPVSQKGRDLIKGFDFLQTGPEYKGPPPPLSVDKKIIASVEKAITSPIWEEWGKRCLKCGGCTFVCPVCYCFYLEDKHGVRRRGWDSCLYSSFSLMAQGVNPLNTKGKRLQHWYNHKFVYFFEKYGIPLCVGCGRCRKVCPGGLDIFKNLDFLIQKFVN